MNVRLLLPARRELLEAIEYYDRQRAGLGDAFRDEAWEAIARIRAFPYAWHSLGGSIRRCQLRRFPYGIVYDASEAEVIIIAVAHLHRNPEYWRSRAP